MNKPPPTPPEVPEGGGDALAFEREKWDAEQGFRGREVAAKEEEQKRLREEAIRSRWSSPLVIAVIAAALAGAGNAFVSWMNGNSAQQIQATNNSAQLSLETFKAESARILEVVKTGDPEQAATNLKFLADVGLISNPTMADGIKKYYSNRKPGESGIALPRPVPTTTRNPESNEQMMHLLQNLESPDTQNRRAARDLLAAQGAAAIPFLAELLARDRNDISYRQALGSIEALAKMPLSIRCAGYAAYPNLLPNIQAQQIPEKAMRAAIATALAPCPPTED